MGRIYYVYVLFDWRGIPRYIGKGKGPRWLQHEKGIDPTNQAKNEFIAETLSKLGCVPRLKLREGLPELEALDTERILIDTIGRADLGRGPLVNRTDGGHGVSGPRSKGFADKIRRIHASRTPEERSAIAKRAVASQDPREFSDRARRAANAVPPDEQRARLKARRDKESPEERSALGRKAGAASALVTASWSPEKWAAIGRKAADTRLATTTKAQRCAAFQNSGLARLSKEELSRNGRMGITAANASRTPEERSRIARKAGAACMANKSEAERLDQARRGGRAAALKGAARSPEERSAIARKRASNMTAERRSEIAMRGVETRRARALMRQQSAQEVPVPAQASRAR